LKKGGLNLCAALLCLLGAAPAFAQGVTVFAAASLADAMNDIVKIYATKSGAAIKTSYAASSALARQIENGAPAELFFSADEEWMDYLEKRSLIEPGTRVARLGNRLVLIAPAGPARRVEIRKGFDLAALLGGGRLATGDPANVPVGRYARQALTYLGVWQVAESKLARADNVRFALTYVERGEALLGIVYATDAAMAKGVQVIGEFPPESHSPISYPLAIVAKHGTAAAKAFHAFLLGGEAAASFKRFGFSVR
jgi:molybdate transport system substrate-binding protein